MQLLQPLFGQYLFIISKNLIFKDEYFNTNYTQQINNSTSWISNISITNNSTIMNYNNVSVQCDIAENNTNLEREGTFSIDFYENNTQSPIPNPHYK